VVARVKISENVFIGRDQLRLAAGPEDAMESSGTCGNSRIFADG